MKIIACLVLVAAFNIYSQDDEVLKLFPGKWKLEGTDKIKYEEWKKISEIELSGLNYNLNNADTSISEEIFIKKFSDVWTYVAIPKNQDITLFALVEFSEGKFVFKNDEHDFPQRVIYEFKGDDKLNASIEGMLNGEFKSINFNFVKVND